MKLLIASVFAGIGVGVGGAVALSSAHDAGFDAPAFPALSAPVAQVAAAPVAMQPAIAPTVPQVTAAAVAVPAPEAPGPAPIAPLRVSRLDFGVTPDGEATPLDPGITDAPEPLHLVQGQGSQPTPFPLPFPSTGTPPPGENPFLNIWSTGVFR